MGRRVGAYIELIEPARDTQRHARRVQHFEQPQETNEAGARPCAAFTNDEVLRFDDVGLALRQLSESVAWQVIEH